MEAEAIFVGSLPPATAYSRLDRGVATHVVPPTRPGCRPHCRPIRALERAAGHPGEAFDLTTLEATREPNCHRGHRARVRLFAALREPSGSVSGGSVRPGSTYADERGRPQP